MEYRNNVYILFLKGDRNDTDYRHNILFIPIEEEELATYLYSRCKELEGMRNEPEKMEGTKEGDFLIPYLPQDRFGLCHTIVDVLMFRVKDGHYEEVDPMTDVSKVDFEEFSEKYGGCEYDYSWSD